MNEMGERVEGAWSESLREIFREVIRTLPDTTTLGELVDATRKNSHVAAVLDIFTVQELIDLAKTKPQPLPEKRRATEAKTLSLLDEEDEFGDDLDAGDSGTAVIRRRADVPDGDLRVLKTLAEQKTGKRDMELLQTTGLASEQLRLILRFLRTKGYLHIDGSGIKRKYRITRHGLAYLRRKEYRQRAQAR